MSSALRRLVALAAVLAPERAERLLRRLGGPGGGEAVRLADALARAPRRARLAALASSLPGEGSATAPRAGPLPSHPLLRRLELERRGRPVAERTLVRATTGSLGRRP
jgi:hypothetical protein